MRVTSAARFLSWATAAVILAGLVWSLGGASPAEAQSCDGNYADGCVPIDTDVDCAGGTGDGPSYFSGVARVVGSDVYGLDRDSDGYACEPAGFVPPAAAQSAVVQPVVSQAAAPVATSVPAAVQPATATATGCGVNNCGFGSSLPTAHVASASELATAPATKSTTTLAVTGTSHVLLAGIGFAVLGLGLIALNESRRRYLLGR